MRIKISFLILLFFCSSQIFAQWNECRGLYGGTVQCFAKKGNLLFAGTPNNGIYKSNDGGNLWSAVNDSLLKNQTIYTIFVDDSTIITGTSYGYFYSTDDAQTWIHCPYTYGVKAICRFGSRIFFATSSGVFYTTDITLPPTPLNYEIYPGEKEDFLVINNYLFLQTSNGLFRLPSTYDEWIYIYLNNMAPSVRCMTGDEYGNIYIATSDKLLKSSNNGSSWIEIPMAQNSNSSIYSLYVSNNRIYAGHYYGLYYSDDIGETWQCTSTDFHEYRVKKIFNLNSNLLIGTEFAGIIKLNTTTFTTQILNTGIPYNTTFSLTQYGNTMFANAYNGIFKSVNCGTNWSDQPIAFKNNHVTYVAFKDSVLFAGLLFHGVYVSHDFGNTWIQSNNGIDSIFHIGISKIFTDDTAVYISTSNHGLYRSFDYGQHWVEITNETLMWNNIEGMGTIGNTLFAISQQGLFKSTDHGQNWYAVNTNFNHQIWSFLAFGTTLFAGTDGYLYRSTNQGLSWMGIDFGLFYQNITSLTTINSLVVASGPNGGVFVSPDYGNSWTQISGNLPNVTIFGLHNSGLVLHAAPMQRRVWMRNMNSFIQQPDSVSGIVFQDLNNNGIQDSSETGLPGVIIKCPSLNVVATSDSLGKYILFASNPIDTVIAEYAGTYTSINPPNYLITDVHTNRNFGIHFIPNIQDLKITITPVTPAFADSADILRISVKNAGTTTINGTAKLRYNDSLAYISSSINPVFISTDSLQWDLTNIQSMETRNINIKLHIPQSMLTGNNLEFQAKIEPLSGDSVPENNMSEICQTITDEFHYIFYETNKKEVSPQGGISLAQIAQGAKLTYTIHFDNTDTDTAFSILIVDTLDARLDASTFELISSSHTINYTLLGNGIIKFQFPEINLPNMLQNQQLCHGFVKFSIAPHHNLHDGDIIRNSASIKFSQYSMPITSVTTNTASTPVLFFVSTDNTEKISENILIFPNPGKDIVTIQSNKTAEKKILKIYNLMGNIKYINPFFDNITIDISKWNTGIYFMSILNNNKITTYKFFKF